MKEMPAYIEYERKAQLKKQKRFCVRAAKDLGYDPEYVAKIRKAKTSAEITRIMATARERLNQE